MIQLLALCTVIAATTTPTSVQPHAPIMVIQNRFGGPTYQREPAFDVTASIYKAGGGAGSFSMVRAFSSMIGDAPMQTEMTSLRAKYGAANIDQFVAIFDFAMANAWKHLGDDNVAVPLSAPYEGRTLAQQVAQTGKTDSGYVFSGYFFDKLLTMKVHNQVNADIDQRFGTAANTSFHAIAAALLFDLAQRLGDQTAKLP